MNSNKSNTKHISSNTVYTENKDNEIYFNPKQVEYLKRIFPSVSRPHTVTNEALRHYNGQQSVIEHIASRIK